MHADGLLDILNVITRGLRQILVLAHTGDIAAPAGNGRQDGLCLVNDGGKREIVGLFAVDLILRADRDLLHIGQDIELRKRDLGCALDAAAVARRDQIDGRR